MHDDIMITAEDIRRLLERYKEKNTQTKADFEDRNDRYKQGVSDTRDKAYSAFCKACDRYPGNGHNCSNLIMFKNLMK